MACEFSVVVPAFNEETGLRQTLESLQAQVGGRGEIIVVDDGSTDQTFEIASASEGVRVIRRPHNLGYGASLKTGIRASRSDIIVTFDADGQHQPEDVLRLVERVADCDMVMGARTRESPVPPLRQPGKFILKHLANYLAGTKIPDLNCGLRVFRKEHVERYFPVLPNGFSFSTTLTLTLLKAGLIIQYVPIQTAPRVGCPSNVRILHDGGRTILLMLRVIMLFNPLKIFVPVSLVSLAVGAALFCISLPDLSDGSVLFAVTSALVFLIGLLADQIAAVRLAQR